MNQAHAARVAALFFRTFERAERFESGVVGVAVVHSVARVLLRLAFEMKAQLGVEFVVQFVFAEQRAPAQLELIQHEDSYASRMIRATAPQNRSQFLRCVSSCFRPVAVNL